MNMKPAWHVVLLLVLLTLAFGSQADVGPQELVKQTTEKMLAALKSERETLKKDPDQIYALVNDIVLPHFDFVRMSKWVLAKHWRNASKAQKLRFIRAFRTLMVRTYATALLDYTDQEIKYLPLRDDIGGGDVRVRTDVSQKTGQPVSINYSLHLRKKGWKVYDVAVDGISLVANYRTSFNTEIKQKGLDELIVRLETHNARAEKANQ